MPPTTTFLPLDVQAPRQSLGHELARHLGEPLMGGNRIELLGGVNRAFEALVAAIDAAQDHINIESDMLEADGSGQALAQQLVARCRQGVKVNLLFDSSSLHATSSSVFQGLRAAGLTVCEYNPLPRWRLGPARRPQQPAHRRLMVVDGRIGFMGGARPAPFALGGGPDEAAADLHVRVEGPVVQRLQRLFIGHWQRHSTTPLPLARYHPPLPAVGTQRASLAASDAGRQRNPYYGALLAAIDSARERVCLNAACMLPPRRLVHTLVQAAERGVQVQWLLPGDTDLWLPLHAGRSHYARLLRAGVRIHERDDRLLHTQACVIDGVWCSVGSSPAERRSLMHDAEAKLVVLDDLFARQLEAVLRDDIARSRSIDAEAWGRRPLWRRGQEALARRCQFLL